MKNVRTIIWDLDETVWFYNDNEVEVLCNVLKIRQKDIFAKQYYNMWDNLFMHFKDKIVTYNGVEQFIEKAMPILQLYHVSANELFRALSEKKNKFVDVNQEAIEMMRYFYEKGFKNISITDWFKEHQERALAEFNALSYMENIYGCDNAFFKNSVGKVSQVIEQLQLDGRREQFIIIGDSLTSDIFFAQKLGIKSIWYNRKGKTNTTSNIPNLEVGSLLELKNIF